MPNDFLEILQYLGLESMFISVVAAMLFLIFEQLLLKFEMIMQGPLLKERHASLH